MSTFYYFISTLPMLNIEETPFFTLEEFKSSARDWINDNEKEILDNLTLNLSKDKNISSTVSEKWNDYETFLRNLLASSRGSKLSRESDLFLRECSDFYINIQNAISEILNNDLNPLEKEKAIDKLRWDFLSDLESEYSFEFEILCVYKLKLMLCLKWSRKTNESGNENYDKIVDDLFSGFNK